MKKRVSPARRQNSEGILHKDKTLQSKVQLRAETRIIMLMFILLAMLFILPIVTAIPNLEIEKIDKGSVVITKLDNPAIFDFVIDNKGSAEKFQIYSLVGVSILPEGFFELPSGETKMEIRATPNQKLREIGGFLSVEYQIYGQKSGIFKDELLIKVVPLEKAVVIKKVQLSPDDSEAKVTIENKENTHLENVKINLKSVFFEKQETISLTPHQQITLQIPITKDTKKIVAGPYILTAEIATQEAKEKIEGVIDYLEKEGLSVEKTSEGFVMRKTTVTKTNVGNIPVTAKVEIKKDILSRLFTVNSPLHSNVERTGLATTYFWEENLGPNESLVVKSTTNYTFPFLVLALLIIIVLSLKYYTRSYLSISKKVSHVRTKGGQFALKVHLHITAKKHIDNIQITDTLPAMAKLYEGYGTKPDSVSAATRKVSWKIPRLNSGETRVFSYIIYSTIRTFGRFELPAAAASFEHDGKIFNILSDKVFFVSDVSER